jgi:hypothetical protein
MESGVRSSRIPKSPRFIYKKGLFLWFSIQILNFLSIISNKNIIFFKGRCFGWVGTTNVSDGQQWVGLGEVNFHAIRASQLTPFSPTVCNIVYWRISEFLPVLISRIVVET